MSVTELRRQAGLTDDPPDVAQLLAAGALPQHLDWLLRRYERLTPADRQMVDNMVGRLAAQDGANGMERPAAPAEVEGDQQSIPSADDPRNKLAG